MTEAVFWLYSGLGAARVPRSAASTVEVEAVPCSVVSMTAFEPLTDPRNGVVSPGGRIVGCPQVVVDGFLVADHLREVLLDPESERYHIIPDTLRQEFIFRIFQFLCLGGQWCQYEDDIQPYLDTTKMLYKDLVR
ncbi:cilia- and flagella-associated protein 300-like [Bacillus rossius redtenbacheri]|uniref:cilia- and flagella-associated protein 300-like n=1 Tax=Bacillus rossius redtenbacheri TaxID=93214 RepID=UPI002FDC8C6C